MFTFTFIPEMILLGQKLTYKPNSQTDKCTGTHNYASTRVAINKYIKLCPRGAQTCALPLFCDRDLEINPVTLKLEGDQDILMANLHTENEAAGLRHSKLRA